ncbi:internalin [Pseudoalteromonas sp. NBT06-2]|uniref:internalin n=1 Tax=Pseudoalteromonas sp. NBT06-2 TaxID=2025950 RepID=UPI000BA5DDEA|nr:internalin [Pseudoalteromonas sp. NBT06-2]PAJ76230.1 internalin [Pseudoalteromonas sp. NBT06-2]
MKIKPILIGIAMAQCPIAIADVTTMQSKQQIERQRSEISGEGIDTLTLGTAYHSEKDGFYSFHSVTGTESEEYGNTELDFTVGVDMSYNRLANMLDGNLGAQLDVPAVKVGIGASYAKENAADEYTGTYTLYLSVKPKKKILIPSDGSGLRPTQAAIDLVNAAPGDKFDNVGNEFVSAIEYGSQVMVNLKFEYKNDEDKVKWGGQLDVDWVGKVSLSGALEKVDDATKRDIKVTVSAIQFGGDTNALLSVIPDQLINCTMSDPTPCFQIFENTINYIKGNYINQFTSLDKYNVAKVYTNTYTRSGPELNQLVPDNPYPSRNVLTKMATKNLSESWINAILDNRRAENLLNFYTNELSSAHKTALENIRDDALFNSFLLADAVSYCNSNPIGDYCRTRELESNSRVINYNSDWLEL